MKPRIIIFEDEPLIRFSLSSKLSKNGFEVFSYSDPTFCEQFFSADKELKSQYDASLNKGLVTPAKTASPSGLKLTT